MGGAERMGYEARGARREVRVRGALLPILLEQEQIISGGALEREQRAALAARCAASLSLSRWWGGQSHSAGSQVRSHSHLLLGRPTYPVLDLRPTRPAPAPSEPRAPPAACCPPAPSSRHCHRAGFRSTSPGGAPQRPFPWDITLGLASDTPRRRPLKFLFENVFSRLF